MDSQKTQTSTPDVRIAFLGDVYLGADPQRFRMAPELRAVLASADLVVCNLEGPVTTHGTAVSGKCALATAPAAIEVLRDWGVRAVSVANNHMFDSGWQGFGQTRDLLHQAGIVCFGAGADLGEAQRPAVMAIKGQRIGFAAYSWGFVQTTCATEGAFGCAPLNVDLMVRQTQDLARQVDMVVLMPHWGYCNYLFPTPDQVMMAARLIHEGAHIIGGHSHVVQGCVLRNGKLLAYSLGDFAFSEYMDRGVLCILTEENRHGGVLVVTFHGGSVESVEFHHTLQRNGQIDLNNTPARQTEHLRRTRPLEADCYADFWRRYVRRRALGRLAYWANVLNWRHIRKETFVGAWLMLKNALVRRK